MQIAYFLLRLGTTYILRLTPFRCSGYESMHEFKIIANTVPWVIVFKVLPLEKREVKSFVAESVLMQSNGWPATT